MDGPQAVTDINQIPVRWFKADLQCSICECEWTATFQEGTPRLECPGCGYMNETPPLAPQEPA